MLNLTIEKESSIDEYNNVLQNINKANRIIILDSDNNQIINEIINFQSSATSKINLIPTAIYCFDDSKIIKDDMNNLD